RRARPRGRGRGARRCAPRRAGVNGQGAWTLIAGSAAITAAIKAAGPIALGGRELPARLIGVLTLLAPALLAALIVTQALADGRSIAPGADTAGVAAAGLVLWRGGSVLAGVAVAVLVTAGLRAL
ncbi:MAG: AzlD domain-containing protein, partial [Actinobacteria bacterium]|nr:AzlD domain-containing protein [Actinomycetota bacterium]